MHYKVCAHKEVVKNTKCMQNIVNKDIVHTQIAI